MNTIQLHTFPIVTDASGDYTQASADIEGAVLQYRYVYDDMDTGADLDIVGTKTGIVVANHDSLGTSSITRAPRQPTHADTGVASLYAAAGEPVEAPIYIGGESLTVTIANGGNAKSGTLYIWTGQP